MELVNYSITTYTSAEAYDDSYESYTLKGALRELNRLKEVYAPAGGPETLDMSTITDELLG